MLDLLRIERDEDLKEYIRSVRERPLHDRVAQGYTWYPLRVLQTGFSLGEKAFVIVERTTQLQEPHQLRAGQTINFYTTVEHVDQPEKQGVINYVERNRMKIILNARDVPDWINMGQLGVDQLFDDRSYREMESALQKVIQAKGNRLAELRDVLMGHRKPHYIPMGHIEALGELNHSQQVAVAAIQANPDVTIIHGPPGTGKTTTLVAAIKQLTKTERSILVCAPSNTAADLLTERLAEAGLEVVRIGNVSRIDEQVLSHTLDSILARHPESKNIKKVKIEAAECRRQSRRYKRSFNFEDRREREHLKTQARELESWAKLLENRVTDEIFTNAQAIICTLVGAAHPSLEPYKFRTCVIDEAAQALEPATWIPITKCSRVVLAGDPFQLPPTVKSIDAARKGLSVTMMERCLLLLPDQVHLLDTQYRMHRAIMNFSNQYFYNGALKAHESASERRLLSLDISGEVLTFFEPVVFIDTAGTGFEEKVNRAKGKENSRYLSKYNPDEALLVREHLLKLQASFKDVTSDSDTPTIGILSPYREQVNYLEELFQPEFALKSPNQRADQAFAESTMPITLNTIDGFQGQERDVIYISLVRSNTRHDIGFLSDYRRMNVAMTRARKLLVVIGDSATIGNNPFYKQFLDYCAEHGAYQTAWEYMQ